MAEEAKDDLLIVQEQEDGSVIVGGATVAPTDDAGAADDSVGTDENALVTHGEDEHGAEESGHADETPEQAEDRRERNRRRRADNKARKNEYVEGLRRQIEARDAALNEMGQRLSIVERKSSGSDMAQIEAAMTQTAREYNFYKTKIEEAVMKADGKLAADATEQMVASRTKMAELDRIKKAMVAPNRQPPPLDPRVASHGQAFLERNPWVNPNGTDQDSRLVRNIDDGLVEEGWNPSTAEYWTELDKRVKKYLPHKTDQGHNANKQGPRIPVAGSSRSDSANTSGGYKVSAGRVKAMKDAGIYDNPKERADMIRRYQEQDRQDRQNGSLSR